MGEQLCVCILSNVSTVNSLFVDTSQLQTSPIIIHLAHYLSSLWLKAYHSKYHNIRISWQPISRLCSECLISKGNVRLSSMRQCADLYFLQNNMIKTLLLDLVFQYQE